MNWGPTRRAALGGAVGALTTLALAACGTDTSSRYDTGYVGGDGVTTEIPENERAKPLDFTGTTYDGKTFTAADHRGQVIVLNVWYASCPPCRKEAPDLQKIHEANPDIQFIGVNIRDDAGPARAFEQAHGITYPSIPDRDASIMYALRGQVAPNAVPSTLVIDTQGRVAARISGAADPSILRAMLERVLAE